MPDLSRIPLFAGTVMCTAVACAAAQPPASPAAAQPEVAPKPATEAQSLLDAIRAQARSLTSYEELSSTRMIVDPPELGEFLGKGNPERFYFAIQQPNKLKFIRRGCEITCDGTTLWVIDRNAQTYTQRPAPAKLEYDLLHDLLINGGPGGQLPFTLGLILNDQRADGGLNSFQPAPGKEVHLRLDGQREIAGTLSDKLTTIPAMVAIDPSKKMVTGLVCDITKEMRPTIESVASTVVTMAKMQSRPGQRIPTVNELLGSYKSARMAYTIQRMKPDPKLNDEIWRFSPSPALVENAALKPNVQPDGAQTPDHPKPPEPPGSEPPPDAQKVIDALRDRARTLESFTEVATWQTRFDPPELASLVGMKPAERLYTAFQRPNRLRAVSRDWEIVCDGTTLWVINQAAQTFTRRPAPPVIDVKLLNNLKEEASLPGSLPFTLANCASPPGNDSMIGRFTPSGDRPVRALAGGMNEVTGTDPDKGGEILITVDPARNVWRKIAFDLTPNMRPVLAMAAEGAAAGRAPFGNNQPPVPDARKLLAQYKSAQMVFEILDLNLNPTFNDESWWFEPDPTLVEILPSKPKAPPQPSPEAKNPPTTKPPAPRSPEP